MIDTVGEPLPLQQVFNFRDVGGVNTSDGRTVVTGRVFRSDGLYRLVDADRELLAPLGLRTVLDLRTDGEVEQWGHAPTEVTGATVRHIGLLENTWNRDAVDHAVDATAFLAERYGELLTERPANCAAVIETIADEQQHGVVFHCAAGKDRTGVVAAILLSLLGVDRDHIAADYAATAPAVARMRAWYHENYPERREVMAQQPPAFMACPPDAILQFLAEVDRDFGGVEPLVTDHFGVDASVIEQLRATLLA